jgi:DNA-binding protein HU-beta
MPTPKKTSSRTAASRRRSSGKEPAALKRLNKSLDTADAALNALRKDVQSGAGDAYKNLRQMVRNARRDSGKLGKAIQKDLDQLQKALAQAQRGATRGRAGGRSTAARSTARRSTGTRTAAKRTTARRSPAKRSSGGRSTKS